MTDRRLRFDQHYRPDRFSEILGQDQIVAFVRSLIRRNKLKRNLLFCGDRGSGKTTLARLYVRALNCEDNCPDGSPCGICSTCTDPDGGGLFEYDAAGLNNEKADKIANLLSRARFSECRGTVRAIFIDEAHALDEDAKNLLLKEIEEGRNGLVFCFATTAPAKLGGPLISRLMVHTVRALTQAVAVQLLRTVADKEGIQYDPKALELLAAVKRNYPRDLVIGLEQLSGNGDRLTVGLVKDAFGVDQVDILLEYGLALADGAFDRATDILSGWREHPVRKAEWVQAYFVSLYYNVVLGGNVVVDAILHSSIREQGIVVERLQERLGLTTNGLRAYWVGLLQFWASHRPIDPAAAQLTLALFEERINVLRSSPLSATAYGVVPPNPPLQPSAVSEETPGPASAITFVSSKSEFLGVDEVREMLNRASYFIQQYGSLFNVVLTVTPNAEGEVDALNAIMEFCRNLQVTMDVPYGACGWAGIVLIERNEVRGVHAQIAAFIPAEEPSRPDVSLKRLLEECHEVQGTPLSVSVSKDVATPYGHERLRFHWDAVYNFCAGLYEPQFDDAVSGRRSGVLDKLKIRHNERREPRPVKPPHVGFLGALTDHALQSAQQFNMSFLSAFDDGVFDFIRAGWELEEEKDRRVEIAQRREKVASRAQYYSDDNLETEQARIRSMWPLSAKMRQRTWSVWWK